MNHLLKVSRLTLLLIIDLLITSKTIFSTNVSMKSRSNKIQLGILKLYIVYTTVY